jgi:hypothetical protein
VTTWGSGNNALCTIVYLNRVATGDRNMILVAIAPTVSVTGQRDVAPSGTWQVEIENRNEQGEALEVNAWIQRDDTPFDFPRHGRQSRFDDPEYQRFEGREEPPSVLRAYGRLKADDAGNGTSYVKRTGTINSLATGRETIVVSGFRRSDGAIARYSSSGPGLASVEKLAFVSAVSDESVACHGVIAAGSRSGCVGIMDGTSVAAPGITRTIAEQIASGRWRGQSDLDSGVTNQKRGRQPPDRPVPPWGEVGPRRIQTEQVIKVNRRENP